VLQVDKEQIAAWQEDQESVLTGETNNSYFYQHFLFTDDN